MLKLVFSGQCAAGWERDVVIANLARLLKQSPELVENRLFTGKPVVVKQVESQAIAAKWIDAFGAAGAILQQQSEGEELATMRAMSPQSDELKKATDPIDKVVDTHFPSSQLPLIKKHPARRGRKAFFVLALFVLVLLVLATFLFWSTRALWQKPTLDQEQLAIVDGLASKNLYALGLINVDHIQSLEVLAQQETDLAALPGSDQNFWDSLEQSGIKVREQIDHVWIAGYHAENRSDALLVLTGNFNPDQIGQWLNKRYIIESQGANEYMFTWLDEQTCEKAPTKKIVVTDNRILVGSATQIAAFQSRLQTGATAETDLTSWQKISGKQLASFAVFVPGAMGAAMGGLPGHMVKEMAANATPATGIYFGVDAVSLPPGVDVSAVVTSSDAVFLKDAHSHVSNYLQEAKVEASQNWPETLALYERLSISQNAEQLRVAIRFDENLQQELGNWISAIFSASFSMGDASAVVAEERLDENAPQFSAVSNTNFPDFSAQQHLDSQFIPAATAGPFGIELKHLEAGEDGFGIALAFKAFDLPNVDSLRSGLSMRVTDVLDAAGKSLAPAPDCGKDILREPVEIGSTWSTNAYIDGKEIPYTAISGNKTIALPQATNLSEVAAITGVFDYQLPRAVERIQLKAPLAGQIIEQHGVRIRFFNSSEDSLRYEFSGNAERLLHVAALNIDGKPLLRQSSMRSSKWLGSGHSVSANYVGKVTGAEVTIATDIVELSYPFTLTSLQPAAGDSTWPLKPQPVALADSEWAALQKNAAPQSVKFWREPQSTQSLGPALLVIQDLSVSAHFGLQLAAEAYISNRYPFTGILNSVQLSLTEVTRRNGEVHPITQQAHFPLNHDGGYWFNGKFVVDEDSPWLKGPVQLRDPEIKFEDVELVRGTIALNRSQAIRTISLPMELGAQWSNEQFTVKIVRWEKGRLVLATTGNAAQLYNIQALDGEGNIVSQPIELSWMFGRAEIALDVQTDPHQLVLLIADSVERVDYPFEIKLPR